MSVELYHQSFIVDENIKKLESEIEPKKSTIKTLEQELANVDVIHRPLIEADIRESLTRKGAHVANLHESLKDLKKPINAKIKNLEDEITDLEANLKLFQDEKRALVFAEEKKNKMMRKCQLN